jgi:hypothetical protein
MPREKQIFGDIQDVAHVWAQGVQSYGATSHRNFYFHNRILYSYGTHFVVGVLLGHQLAAINADSYSVSTNRHQTAACRAVNRPIPVPGLTSIANDLSRIVSDPTLTDCISRVEAHCATHALAFSAVDLTALLSAIGSRKNAEKMMATAQRKAADDKAADDKRKRDAAVKEARSYAEIAGNKSKRAEFLQTIRNRQPDNLHHNKQVIGDVRRAHKVSAREKHNARKAVLWTFLKDVIAADEYAESRVQLRRTRMERKEAIRLVKCGIASLRVGYPVHFDLVTRQQDYTGAAAEFTAADYLMIADVAKRLANSFGETRAQLRTSLAALIATCDEHAGPLAVAERNAHELKMRRRNLANKNTWRKDAILIVRRAIASLEVTGDADGINWRSKKFDSEFTSSEQISSVRLSEGLRALTNLSTMLHKSTNYSTLSNRLAEVINRRREAERAAEKAKQLAAFEAWKKGSGAYFPYEFQPDDGTALVRAINVKRNSDGEIVGGKLETSHGANVPLVDALKVFRRVNLCRLRNITWKRNGETLPVGHFQVDAISANGDFVAGCHKFRWQVIANLARELGIFIAETEEMPA